MTADADGPADDMIDGRVEQLDELFGVSGWAVDRRDPSTPLTLELWAGDTLIDTARTGEPREDVCNALQVNGMPGYKFAPEVRERIRAASDRGLSGDLAVRVAGFAKPLESLAGSRSLELVRMGGAQPSNRDALLDRLSLHASAARDTFEQPLRPMPGRGIGFVEAVAIDDSGLTWVIGWMKDDVVQDRPLVILDNGKYAAGFAYALVARDDLPPDSKGFVGILHTDWRASAELPPYFFLADGSARFLESLLPTPIRTKTAVAPAVRDLLARAVGGHRDLLRELFHTIHSWSVAEGQSKDLLHVDEIAILPGFGALVNGWALSPSKESERFVLKAGNRIMLADDRAIARFARPDIAHIYPGAELAVERAGFTALFRGDLSGARLDELVVKGTWTDGTATNAAILPDRARILGVTAPIENALAFYPALEAESFFPDFARHAAAHARDRATVLKPYEIEAVDAAVVLAAPAASSDLSLLFDRAIRHAAALPTSWGLTIVARSDSQRALVIALFAELKRATGRPCSLFFATSQEIANDVLGGVIDALVLTRFAWVGAGATLTVEGWRALAAPTDGLTLFEMTDPAARDAAAITSLDAFACDTETWRTILAGAPPRIGGVMLDPAMPHRIVPAAALSLGAHRPSALVARINEIEPAPHG